jgi:hypothetical protein
MAVGRHDGASQTGDIVTNIYIDRVTDVKTEQKNQNGKNPLKSRPVRRKIDKTFSLTFSWDISYFNLALPV